MEHLNLKFLGLGSVCREEDSLLVQGHLIKFMIINYLRNIRTATFFRYLVELSRPMYHSLMKRLPSQRTISSRGQVFLKPTTKTICRILKKTLKQKRRRSVNLLLFRQQKIEMELCRIFLFLFHSLYSYPRKKHSFFSSCYYFFTQRDTLLEIFVCEQK